LTLLQSYGANAWRIHNYQEEQVAKNIERALEELKELTVEVNRERKNSQVRISVQLAFICKINLSPVGPPWEAAHGAGNAVDQPDLECAAD
jgi:hypothetical protein